MDSPEPPVSRKAEPSARTLKIEEDGDRFRGGIKPKIRLMGRWLERAGFRPGSRVSVVCLAPGVLELRCAAYLATEQRQTLSEPPECPF